MGYFETQQQLVTEVKSKTSRLAEEDISGLLRVNDLGPEINFLEGKNSFEKIIKIAFQIKAADLKNTPVKFLSDLSQQLDLFIREFDRVKKFSLRVGSPSNNRDNILRDIDNNFDALFQHAYQVLSSDLTLNENSQSSLIQTLQSQTSEALEKAKTNLGEMQEILKKARDASAQTGFTQYEIVFENESIFHQQESKKWFRYIVSVLLTIIISGTLLLFYHPDLNNTSDLIQISLAKVIILTSLLYGLSVCLRNYKAHKHNSILNKHRQNALKTFETFSKAAGDDTQTKNAVLLEATHTIFSNQQTGYLNAENEQDPPNKIVEIFRSQIK